MKRQKFHAAILLLNWLAMLSCSVTASAVEVYAGTGIGYSNNPNQWVANIVFAKSDKRDIKTGLTASLRTGQDLTPSCAAGTAPDCAKNQSGLATLIVPPTGSTAWCDPAANPNTANSGKYTVTAAFDEPAYNAISVPRDTVFKGTFSWDSATKTLQSLRGTMNQVMVSADQTLNLTHLLNWSYDQASDTVTASVFRNDSTAIFLSGGYDNVPGNPLTDGTSNAFFTLNFKASDPTAVSQDNIDKLIYGDCIGGSLMNNGTLCMTGLLPKGSMDGFPQSLTITSASAAAQNEPGTCYGSANGSKWTVVDLNGLQKAGLKSVWVTVTAKRYDDQDGTATDDDLIPALTVFRGRQDVGVHGFWYPNQFQESPDFWAWKLSPFHTTTAKSDTSGGWATAHGADDSSSASVSGQVPLKPGNQNYLTVALGGDARDGSSGHDVNFELTVTVRFKKGE